MPDPSDFQRRQYEFAAHIRDPDRCPAPAGIEDRRMAIYRELFFNNLSGLLANAFPVIKKLIGADAWNALVRGFMRHHEAHTPLFLEIPKEFLQYLRDEREADISDPPYLLELAHYEWVELALSVAEDPEPDPSIDPDGDLLDAMPVVSPLAWPLAYSFPVHRISMEYRPSAPPPEPTYLVVYRKLDDALGFMELNVVTARMLELLDTGDAARSGREVLSAIAAEIRHPDADILIAAGRETLQRMRTLDVILGARNSRQYR